MRSHWTLFVLCMSPLIFLSSENKKSVPLNVAVNPIEAMFNFKSTRMTTEENQPGLQRYRAIVLATLDYLDECYGGSIVYDQYDPIKEYYLKEKIRTEQYFRQGKLDRLEQQLNNLVKGPQSRVDLNFASYIKGKTGYDIDIFEDLSKRADAIIEQAAIRSEKELNDIGIMFRYYQALNNTQKVEKLHALLTSYSNETKDKRKSGYSEVVRREEKDGIVKETIKVSTGPKPKHYVEHEEISPDGKRKLRLAEWSDGEPGSTYVAVEFPAANGVVYGVSGIHSDIKAWWKDNSTIVIETKKEYGSNTRYKEVKSFDDVITINYIEH